MEALREENVRLKRRVKATNGKGFDESGHARPRAIIH